MTQINILSKKISNSKRNKYDFSSLFSIDEKYKKFFIASAYSDCESLRRIFNIFKENCSLKTNSFKIFIDRSASKIIGNARISKRYRTLNTEIKKFCSDKESGIYLVNFNGKLFHTKLIYIETKNKNKIISGSINMTCQGIDKDKNEEIIVEHKNVGVRLCNKILSYFDKIKSYSLRVDNNLQTNKIASARDFFLSGVIFYKPDRFNLGQYNLNFPKGFNIKDQLPRVEQSSSGSINLFSAWLSDLNLSNAHTERKKENNRYKTWCIETDFGYFAPYEFKKNVESYNYISKEKKEFLEKQIIMMLNSKDKFYLDLLSDFEKISEIASNQGVKWKIDIKSWKKFFDSQMKKFADEEYRDLVVQRISSYLIEVPMPDIWNDPFSLLHFKENFFEFIESNIKRSKNISKGEAGNNFIKAIQKCNKNPLNFDDLEKILVSDNFSKALIELSNRGLNNKKNKN